MISVGPLLLTLVLVWTTLTEGYTNRTFARCNPAQKNANATLVSIWCRPYRYPEKGHCKHVLKNSILYGNKSEQKEKHERIQRALRGKKIMEDKFAIPISQSCFESLTSTYCRYAYPTCNQNSEQPLPRSICRETCEDTLKTCDDVMKKARFFNRFNKKHNFHHFYWDVIDCSHLQYRNGGDTPGCYYSPHLNNETDKLQHKECFYGNGLGYRGHMNMTRSGQLCQSWSSQCPHRHDHPLSEYPELVKASNWCRNPGGQGPNGPWCYTTNSSIRWEYCDVEKCPPPAPSLAPAITQAYASGPSRISIKWNPVPLPFIHGQNRGFKLRITKFSSGQLIAENRSQMTEFHFENLQALTNYNISVLALNEHGDGLSSHVFVKTLPKDYVAVKYTLRLYKPARITNARMKKELSFVFKTKMLRLLQSKNSTREYIIHHDQMKMILSNGSKQMEIIITAELKGRSSWSAVQDITGRIQRALENKRKVAKEFEPRSLLVQAPPPPPANVSINDVTNTSAVLEWSLPLYHGPYKIARFIVQYKKAGTNLDYYDAVTVSSAKTKVTVKGLNVDTKYLMRVVSVNEYGFQASDPEEVETQQNPKPRTTIMPIILTFVGVFVVVLVIGAVLLRWWYKKRMETQEIQDKLQKLRDNPKELAVNWFDVLKIKITKQWWEIPRDELVLDEHELGSGAFDVVMKGYLTKREEGTNENRITCAVKMLKDNPTERKLRDLCNEINVMSSVGDHPNLVSLIGACTFDGPPWLVLKFAPNGCLLEYLKDNRPPPEYENTRDLTKSHLELRPISEKERMKFAYEIAQGMAHLERHRFVHRDLSARNVLLGKNMVAMVSDFGFSRDIYETGVYEKTSGGLLPIRWMALESLQDYAYTSKSDIWAYGVVLWEIESDGLMPYAGMSGEEVVEKLLEGYRLERPSNTSRKMYDIMWQCWNPDPDQRPTFADLVYNIGGLINLSRDS